MEGLQHDFCKVWKNHLDFVLWGWRTSHSICGCGPGSFPDDFMRFGVGGLQNDFAGPETSFGLCVLVSEDFPLHLRLGIR